MKNQFQSVIIAPIDSNIVYNNNNNNIGLLKKNKKRREEDKEIRGKKGTYKGATVLEPVTGIHSSNNDDILLGSVDFASLYPNIMLSYGIIRGYVTRVSKMNYKKKWDNYFTRLSILNDSKNFYLSCKKDIDQCPISYICKRLIEKRNLNRKTTPTLANALKILVNSLYCICRVEGSPLYDQIAATMITAYGRHHLTRAKTFFENTFDRLTVLYGDTDSLFIKCVRPNQTLYEMADRYNRYLSDKCGLESIQLSVDGIYQCIILIRKKLYMGKYTNDRYKLSGFPQRLKPHLFNLMVESLHYILDVASTTTTITILQEQIRQFYQNLLNK